MNYVLVFRPEVREELDEAYSWYESQQLELGDDFLDCVDEMLNRICYFGQNHIPLSIVMLDGVWCDAFPMLFTIGLCRVG